MNKIKVGQIGTGHPHASGKMQVLRKSNDFEVVGLAEPDPTLREQAKRNPAYKDLEWFETEELLNRSDVQAIAIETEVSNLLDVAEKCVAAGKHIHLDKPAGSSLPHFHRIVDAAARQHLALQLGYMYRYHPGMILLNKLTQLNALGEIYSVNGIIGKLMTAESRSSLLTQPGGIMFELGGHLLDVIVKILGKPESLSTVNRHSSPIDDGLLDNMLTVLSYPTAHATLHSSCNEVEGFSRRQLVVCGTRGTLEVRPMPNPKARLSLLEAVGPYRKGTSEIELGKYVRYINDIAEFARVIRQEKDPDYSYQHDLDVQETLLAISGLPLD